MWCFREGRQEVRSLKTKASNLKYFIRLLKIMYRTKILLSLLWLSNGLSFDKITPPKVTRDFKLSTEQCAIKCSVLSMTNTNLLWMNGSEIYSILKITDVNTNLYLAVDYHDKNNYSCVWSVSGVNHTTRLNTSYLCLPCREENLTMMSASEGDSVTLPTNLTEVLYKDHIAWLYRDAPICDCYKYNTTYLDCDSCGFSNRLQMESKTGSLIITNISKTHSGLYKLRITNEALAKCMMKSYNVTVYNPLPVPDITEHSTQCSSSSACVVMCSVNVTDVTLSWYNGSRLNSSIYVSDVKTSNFLCLEVEYQDTNTYSCVVNNSFTNKTRRLNISELCKDHSQKLTGGAIAGLVVGVVLCLVVFWIKCIRKRPSQEEPSRQGTSGNNANAMTPLMTQQSR